MFHACAHLCFSFFFFPFFLDTQPDSKRVAFVGTDNVFMGRTMARLLRQLRPGGGTFAIIGAITGRYEGFIDEIYKDNHREDRAHWDPVEVDVPESVDDPSLSFMEQMEIYAPYNPTAFVIMKQTPMRHENWTQFIDKHRHRNITFIGTDGSDYQLDYLNRRYVDGLVGQLPHEFGTESIKVMYQYLTTYKLDKDFYPTNVVAYNLIPLDLPPLQMDENLLGDLRFVGYTFFGIIICSAITCVSWTISNRKAVVVNAAQPSFLVTVATGVMIMSSTLIPLSFDDGGEAEAHSESFNVGICMSIPWLASVGFTVTFAALFSKTWRVNRIFLSDNSHARVTVSEMDVLAPFLLLLTCNIIVLVCWTVIDPLSYERREYDGTDYWNRVLASYGACTSDSVGYYVMPLAFINFSVLLIACYQAYRARNIESGKPIRRVFQALSTTYETRHSHILTLSFRIFRIEVHWLDHVFSLPSFHDRNSDCYFGTGYTRSILSRACIGNFCDLYGCTGFDLSTKIFEASGVYVTY